jgi:hypothetical protein
MRGKRRGAARSVLLFLLLIAVAGCQQGDRRSAPDRASVPVEANRLADGVYAVLRESSSPDSARVDAAGSIVLLYDQKYSEADQGGPPEYLAIDTNSFVPLILEGAPDATKDGRGFTLLSVTLARDQVKPLEEFTRAHLGGKVAVVLDGEVISKHKVRSVIEGGKVQITRCGDNACDVLRAKLMD